ncbi:MAG: GNAT family N-acetyltransferase [Gammaproteobacteria bacterium]|nr:GNAT family N-acetyltransferase [Gammaproteobacteria bacterium]
MDISVTPRLDNIAAAAWNALAGNDNPFLRHEFLVALERHGCVGRHAGWVPQHITAYDRGQLVGAAPMYLKYNSHGEFVFDWAWAEAYERNGMPYYPKLVVAVPYTPATGPRLLLADSIDQEVVAGGLVEAILDHARRLQTSSVHWLFTTEHDTTLLERHGFMRRSGFQFHWHNPGYRDFSDFLSSLSAEKRKKIKQERRRVREAGIEIEILSGHQVSAEQWKLFHAFYCSTFDRKGGSASLTLEFFMEIGRSLAEHVVLVLAQHDGKYVAGAFNLRGGDTLYGRHWGCAADFHGLHFECCYYSLMEYCISHRLVRFEAGAQGEHKLARGFLPTPTWSAHWFAHPAFSAAVQDFLTRETFALQPHLEELHAHSPFKPVCR